MSNWLARQVGESAANIVMILIVIIAIVLISYLIMRLIIRLTSGTYVAGGRKRVARLSVRDAAAVDNRRRLVLVRRDNVEHLILIGGPTDVVVERNIAAKPLENSDYDSEPETQHAVLRKATPAPAPTTEEKREPVAAAPVVAPTRHAPKDPVPHREVQKPVTPVQQAVPQPQTPRLDPTLSQPHNSAPKSPDMSEMRAYRSEAVNNPQTGWDMPVADARQNAANLKLPVNDSETAQAQFISDLQVNEAVYDDAPAIAEPYVQRQDNDQFGDYKQPEQHQSEQQGDEREKPADILDIRPDRD